MLSSTQIYHVMVRGNERKTLFLDDQDYRKFVKVLRTVKEEAEYDLYAFCMMNNHVHLLIHDDQNQLPQIMKAINTSFALYFNKKYDRVGHVFQGRFKSEVIEDTPYLLTAVRYIHNNPVKAGLVNNPVQYKWSSYSTYIHDDTGFKDLIDTNTILDLFETERQPALAAFMIFSQQSSAENLIEPWKEERAIISPGQESKFVREYLSQKNMGIDDLNKKEYNMIRRELIKFLKSNSALTIRQIGELLNIDRNVIQRIK